MIIEVNAQSAVGAREVHPYAIDVWREGGREVRVGARKCRGTQSLHGTQERHPPFQRAFPQMNARSGG